MSEQPADPAPHVPQVLKFRLTRATPFTTELGCTFLIFLVLAAVAAIGILAGRSDDPDSKNNWVAYVVGGAFGFFALLVLWSWIRQMVTRGIKVPLVELSDVPLHIGQSATLAMLQEGPASLKSLRANLLCIETTVRNIASSGKEGPRQEVTERFLVQDNIFDTSYLRVAHGDVWHESREFTVPAGGKPTQGEDDDAYFVRWRIEVWGRVGLIGSFMHPFRVKVLA